jgi:cellulose synthase/poly-beta-1,6-N-acetylglucosamine synthase-like glycosyltransferase
VIEVGFWLVLILLVYLHGGYALILAASAALRRSRPQGVPMEGSPAVTVLIGAYNEEAVIRRKLDCVLAQDYSGPLHVVVASDRSTDGTHDLVRSYEHRGVRLVIAPERRGKAANFSSVVPELDTDFVILTDAGGIFEPDVVRRLMAHFWDPEVGCVGGRVIYGNLGASGVSRGEGLYWRYEVLLRALESRLGGTVIVSGTCYAIRKLLFRPVPAELPDDFMSPLNVWDQGYRVHYETGARVHEEVAETLAGEFRTKTRIVSRNYSALRRMRHLLSPWRRPILAWKLWSHRLLRWLVAPLLALLLLLNLLLLPRTAALIFLALQLGFYLVAALGLAPGLRRFRVFWIPMYFCLVNLSAAVGVWQAWRGRISGVWDPVERQVRG